ncbi:DNA ligase/mRNA capping enzyme [Fomitiporia mediterranea MF3/22]|uniref:DNA ligase/mRNA capping enzyme n=1 Tax=Fomitiporia mediterranea (strain MF3/22) TaxID=694068 RepID=UPI0004408141|nr:DNA ligase/mRNA capping enzyme [Fomitiporia mediterranea MF3/22]EJC98107.1 DNA ligase/mRNA capping enzyme [Fomitiporia mediterranea MF3/22]
MSDKDELAEIDGVKPKKYLKDGEECEAKSHTSNSVYKIKRTWDHYYCTCPAWRNQSRAPVNARSCKHLRSVLGDAYEDARICYMDPDGAAATNAKNKNKSKSKSAGKRRKRDDGDDDDDVSKSPKKKSRGGSKPVSKGKSKDRQDEEDDEGEDGSDESSNGRAVVEVLLAVKWDLEKGVDPTGWWVSEKLDGVRVYWDGKRMLSRLGNPFTPPKWFIEKLPKDATLDGELFGGRGQFQSTVSIVKTSNSPRWNDITFQVFDVPSMGEEPFEDRLDWLKSNFTKLSGERRHGHINVVEHVKAKNREHVLELLKEVEKDGGEGLMLREPGSQYVGSRSSTLQKVKTFHDAEAKVTGYVPGKGKHQGVMGALKCVMASGKTFNVGTGFSDKQRAKPPKICSIITYRFQELTLDGVPRFPSFIGEALDKDKPTDAVIPYAKKADVRGNNEDGVEA